MALTPAEARVMEGACVGPFPPLELVKVELALKRRKLRVCSRMVDKAIKWEMSRGGRERGKTRRFILRRCKLNRDIENLACGLQHIAANIGNQVGQK